MMLGVLGIQIMVEDDKNVHTSRPFIVVANYTSVLDHFIVDVVINNIVVSGHAFKHLSSYYFLRELKFHF